MTDKQRFILVPPADVDLMMTQNSLGTPHLIRKPEGHYAVAEDYRGWKSLQRKLDEFLEDPFEDGH